MTKEEREKVIELRANGLTINKIARSLNLPLNTVKSYIQRNKDKKIREIRKEEKSGKDKKRKCKTCGNEITTIRKTKGRLFCCDTCRDKWWNKHRLDIKKGKQIEIKCINCNTNFNTYISKNRKFCSHDCYIAWRFKNGNKGQDVSHDNGISN